MRHLKPCPLCGDAAELVYEGTDYGWEIYCTNISCLLSRRHVYDVPEDAVDAWNDRENSWIAVTDAVPSDGEKTLICWVLDYPNSDPEYKVDAAEFRTDYDPYTPGIWGENDGRVIAWKRMPKYEEKYEEE